MYDVTIIGAGVVGAMCARTLTRYGLKVIVVERENDVAMGATKANSAIVHAGFDAKEGSLKAKLNVRGSEMMAEVCRELGVKYINNGSLVIAFNSDEMETLKELLTRGNANGVKGLKIVDAQTLRSMEPGISDSVEGALYAPTGAIVAPYELAVAAIGNAMDNGAELKTNFEVRSICATAEDYQISDGNETIISHIVINAAGLYSDKVAAMIGDTSFSVHPRRGEYILLDKGREPLVKHTIFRTPSRMGKGILVTATVDGNTLLGPTSVDMDDKTDTNTTSDGFDKIISQARENVSSLPISKSITSFCGLRAVGSTGDFIITTPRRGFINLAGIESPGLSASPAIAEYVAELLADSGYELKESKDFNPFRENMNAFREMDIASKNNVIKKDSAYGRIICRCEGVTEGEILRAIRTNPRPSDLDGVKRRTRAQMGRCQGGFCMPYITELLAKELGIPMEAVTKSGIGSEIITGKTKEDVQ